MTFVRATFEGNQENGNESLTFIKPEKSQVKEFLALLRGCGPV